MSPKVSWYEWLEDLIAQFPSATACAAYLGIDGSKLSRWRRPYHLQAPTATDMDVLAERTGTPLPDILLMVQAAVRDRERLGRRRGRPTMGGGSSANPLPKPTARPQPVVARSSHRHKSSSDNKRPRVAGKRDSVAPVAA